MVIYANSQSLRAVLCWPNVGHSLKRGEIFFIFPVKTFLSFLGNFLQTLGDFLLKPSGHPGRALPPANRRSTSYSISTLDRGVVAA